jgi:nuclear transport factor 2 (NTF2) superfamily protein
MTEAIAGAGAHAAWLDAYRRAWETRNADAAEALFTEDALYRERAFGEPFTGRAAIRDYWARVTADQRDIRLVYGEAVSRGDRVAVEWWVTLHHQDREMTLAGEFMLRFAPSGLCQELREYWVLSEGRHEPPAGWGQ